ncbi:MAG: fructose,6-bisphosphatase [Herbinix sp.]|jgi:fructose-1,6-bisphosphatase-3|nr:fructose,6-bisphosphatase [Herbinix sp.]
MIDKNSASPLIDDSSIVYLELLSKLYPRIDSASTEIINLQAILNLPKGTEHFISDIHGENEAFDHVMKNASGVIKRKINEIFGNSIREYEKRKLATLIYYPEQKLDMIAKEEDNLEDWYKITLLRLIQVSKSVSSKYTRSKVRKALPKDFSYILEELIHEDGYQKNKQEYYDKIIETIIQLGRANAFIIAISKLIQRLAVDRLHILGDIYDRGPGADYIMDELSKYHSLDIQWGNHDILWMGAASGSEACICNVIRNSCKYNNLRVLEDGYGINLIPLATFALELYKNNYCESFIPVVDEQFMKDKKEYDMIAAMHKAITIIQFKLEGKLIHDHPEYQMDHRRLLDKIDYQNYSVIIEGNQYQLLDNYFPTIQKEDPYKLTVEEEELVEKLKTTFLNSNKLQEHIRLLLAKGSMYTIYNSNLLYHGCIPIDEEGNFIKLKLDDREYNDKELFDQAERILREGYFERRDPVKKKQGIDLMWYLWCGCNSPLYGKKKMATFEQYFIDNKEIKKEGENCYFQRRESEEMCSCILKRFGLDPTKSHIINGHVPVKVVEGENPIKANGKLLVIDGGFAKAYQKVTGIAGYTLIYNSYGLLLASHEPFENKQKAIEEEKDILTTTVVLEQAVTRIRVGDTDVGKELKKQIEKLELLLYCYEKGIINEVI